MAALKTVFSIVYNTGNNSKIIRDTVSAIIFTSTGAFFFLPDSRKILIVLTKTSYLLLALLQKLVNIFI